MKKLIVLLLLLSPFVYANVSVIDDANYPIHLKKPATRIISLAPNITEILYAIGAGSHIIGVIKGSDYPAQVKALPVVGTASSLDLEKIVALKPDLIIAWKSGNPMQQVQKLKALGLPVYVMEPTQLQDITKSMINLGILTNRTLTARAKAKQFQHHIAYIKRKYAKMPKVKVFYQIWSQPIYTVGSKSIINQMITICGGKNVFAHLAVLAPQVSIEAVIKANPEVIITGEKLKNLMAFWENWPQVAAVKEKRLYRIDPDLMQRPGPRIAQGLVLLCQDIHANHQKER